MFRWWHAFYLVLGGYTKVELCIGYIAPVAGATWADYLRELSRSLHTNFVQHGVWETLQNPDLRQSIRVLVFESEYAMAPFVAVNLWTGQRSGWHKNEAGCTL